MALLVLCDSPTMKFHPRVQGTSVVVGAGPSPKPEGFSLIIRTSISSINSFEHFKTISQCKKGDVARRVYGMPNKTVNFTTWLTQGT